MLPRGKDRKETSHNLRPRGGGARAARRADGINLNGQDGHNVASARENREPPVPQRRPVVRARGHSARARYVRVWRACMLSSRCKRHRCAAYRCLCACVCARRATRAHHARAHTRLPAASARRAERALRRARGAAGGGTHASLQRNSSGCHDHAAGAAIPCLWTLNTTNRPTLGGSRPSRQLQAGVLVTNNSETRAAEDKNVPEK